VLLLEAGGTSSIKSHGWSGLVSRLPTALAMPMHLSEYNWAYAVEPEPALDGRVVTCPRGKGFGGSSAINGMVYVRGHPRDFDAWNDAIGEGAAGEKADWGAADVLPYFRRMEHVCEAAAAADNADAVPRRGREGPLQVSHGRNALGTALYEAFIRAGEEAGYGSMVRFRVDAGPNQPNRPDAAARMHMRLHACLGACVDVLAAFFLPSNTPAVRATHTAIPARPTGRLQRMPAGGSEQDAHDGLPRGSPPPEGREVLRFGSLPGAGVERRVKASAPLHPGRCPRAPYPLRERPTRRSSRRACGYAAIDTPEDDADAAPTLVCLT
jgi:choline dehydrogenase-like flavoprotein